MFELESRRRPAPDINLSALIDIAFILVIFIVLGATFHRVRAVDVDLPRAAAESEPDNDGLIITVPREGPVRFGDRPVADHEIDAALAAARDRHKTVVLLADRDAAVERAVTLLVAAQRHGFAAVSIATDPKKRPEQP